MTLKRGDLYYKAWHRGTKELDCILGGFFNSYYETLPERQKQAYEELLNIDDAILYDWIVCGVCESKQKEIINLIRKSFGLN